MNIFSTIDVVIGLVNLLVQYEPALEKDVRDIIKIVHDIRTKVAASEGKK